MHHVQACPVCNQTFFKHFLTSKDYTATGEIFDLDECASCGFVFTNPRPEDHQLSKYYQSDAYISHSNKTSGIIDQAYKLARKFTLKWKYELVRKHSQPNLTSILDYGCGTGAFLHTCQLQKLKTDGVEPNDGARRLAQSQTGVDIKATIDDIKDSYDTITLWHVLEHVSNLNETVSALKSRMNKNGTVFIAVPNHKSKDAQHYKEHWAAYDVPRHLWHFTQRSMTQLLTNHNLTLKSVLPMSLDAYYVSLLSEKYKAGNANPIQMARAILNATKSNYNAKKTNEYSSLIYIARK